MLRKQNLYCILACTVALTSCHSSANKGTGQSVQKKDTVKANLNAPPTKGATGSFMILDTVADRDTIKVVLYRDSMIRCSINNLSDTFNAARDYMHWDTSYSNFIKEGVAPILIPGKIKPAKFTLNDSLLIFPILNGNFRTKLYLVNRTKKSLKFAKNGLAGSYSSSYYVYVDLKNNILINYEDKRDIASNTGGEDKIFYPIYRYRIENKNILKTNSTGAYFKEFDKLDILENNMEDVRTFYNIIVHRENWERDKYKLSK